MQILFIGDVVGRPGRTAIKHLLPEIKQKYNLDLIILNAENISHGKGVTMPAIKEMQEVGIDFFTSGNHIWSKREIFPYLDDKDGVLIRPANYGEDVPGVGAKIFETKSKKKVLIINLQGRVFFPQNTNCPFLAADEILEQYKKENFAAIIVDFHAEATSEKIALKHYLDGRISALIGTHTHIQTADAEITAKKTAYLTDVGMVGKKDSVIGIDKEPVLKRFLTQLPVEHEISHGDAELRAVLIEVDEKTGKAENITPLVYNYYCKHE